MSIAVCNEMVDDCDDVVEVGGVTMVGVLDGGYAIVVDGGVGGSLDGGVVVDGGVGGSLDVIGLVGDLIASWHHDGSQNL